MKAVKKSIKDVSLLGEKNISGLNSESSILYEGKYVIKCFKGVYDLDNKKIILDILDSKRVYITKYLPEIILPDFYLFIDGSFEGYGMRNYIGRTLEEILSDLDVPFLYKRNCLIKVGEFLEKMKIVRETVPELKDFYLNDLHEGNIIITYDGKVKITDVDSCKIDNSPNFRSLYLCQPYYSRMFKLSKYLKGVDSILANDESDLYCYIMIVLNFLISDKDWQNFRARLRCAKYEKYLSYLEVLIDAGISSELLESLYNVYEEENNINPYRALSKVKSPLF